MDQEPPEPSDEEIKKLLDEATEHMKTHPGDYKCLIHGKWMSEHQCLYCCLCFKTLTIEECNTTADGRKEDVCIPCANEEREAFSRRCAAEGSPSPPHPT